MKGRRKAAGPKRDVFKQRLAKLRRRLAQTGLDENDPFLVSARANIQYLCGFTGSYGFLTVSAYQATLYTDGRYTTQARAQACGVDICAPSQRPLERLLDDLKKRKAGRIGFEENRLSYALYQALRRALRRARFEPLNGVIEQFRLVKSADEIKKIRRAARLNSKAFDNVCSRARVEWTESRFAAELDLEVRLLGADGPAFETIVASGAHSALPHAHPRPVRLAPNSLIVVDHGAILDGYNSDMTRALCFGRIGETEQRMVRGVSEAQQAAVAAVRSGVQAGTIDRAARKVLEKFDLADAFPHATGHGVGLEIHEQPRIGVGEKTRLTTGMVITIEPGAYLDGIGGVRIEDLAVVTKSGCEILSRTPRQLRVL
ncbi:MAG: Xaa-Pro peptidase family protein [Acidobacteria bacterium]|nr:Xaa-Pro peptidase family protein [Acidobacteriota bacterium]